jgi:predicted dienelactone hydrolase
MRGQSPLIVFSHGFHGCKTQSTFLMEALADAGYLVVAPDHKDAACGSGGMLGKAEEPFRDPSAWSDKTYKDRGDDISKLLDAMRRDSQWRQIDWSNVGLAGHSLGGYTVLGLAGSWPGWKLNSIRAVLALSPYCEPYIFKGRLDKVGVPVMFQGGTRDLGITPSVKRSFGCYDKTPAPAYFVEFQAAGHFAWTDLVTDYQDLAEHYSVAFFDRYLRGTSVVPLTMRVSGVSDLRIK